MRQGDIVFLERCGSTAQSAGYVVTLDPGSTTLASGVGREFSPCSVKDLLWNGFKTNNPLGRWLKRIVKRMLGKA